MSLDGLFLRCIKNELENCIVGAKVDKVYQPSGEELILSLRTRGYGGKKLLLCTRANSPRVHITDFSYENPAVPPMLCMLLRKRLGGATVIGIRQIGCDRVLFIDFSATNEMGDKENLSLVIEIMAQYSNVILIDGEKKIIDALKRVDYTKSSVRLVLPGVNYELPPSQNKFDIFETDLSQIIDKLGEYPNKPLSSALIHTIMGISPIVAREISSRTLSDDCQVSMLSDRDLDTLTTVLENLKLSCENGSTEFFMFLDEIGKPFDFSFVEASQYGNLIKTEQFDTASALLDSYYSKRDSVDRIAHRTADIRKLLSNISERIVRKTENQRAELETCKNRELLRISAELINANLYRLEKGTDFFELENYYDDNKLLKIPVDPALSPAQNSQKYFKEYKKTYTAEKKLREQIESGLEELNYIETVTDSLSRVTNERDIMQIREELVDGGYIKSRGKGDKLTKNAKSKNTSPKRTAALPPTEYETTDGYRVFVGRNNIQNDRLSLKTAAKLDMWLHTKDYPGSHVIIENINGEVSDKAIEEAAIIAAVNSTAKDASKVPVNYTLAKNLKKPTGAKPGKVIYHVYNTIYVTPDADFAESRCKNK